MSQLSLSADETGSAVVVSGYEGGCRHVGGIVMSQRLHGRLALSGGARYGVLGAKFIVLSCQLRVSSFQKRGDEFAAIAKEPHP